MKPNMIQKADLAPFEGFDLIMASLIAAAPWMETISARLNAAAAFI